ncbi:class I SAM-dependent methyltransferase [candidate division KSB1 bacterium]|nr:class I SAM-dependent methyltransferase [candidate division KSB1 bacterium]
MFHHMDKIFKYPRMYGAKLWVIRNVLGLPARLIADIDITVETKLAELSELSVADIGCGRGELSQQFPNYVGLEVSLEMIHYCREKYPDKIFDLIKNGTLPIQDRAVELSILIYVLHHVQTAQERIELLKEASRVGRKIIIAESIQSESPVLHPVKSFYWMLTDGGFHYHTVAELHSLFEAASLNICEEHISTPLHQLYWAILEHHE